MTTHKSHALFISVGLALVVGALAAVFWFRSEDKGRDTEEARNGAARAMPQATLSTSPQAAKAVAPTSAEGSTPAAAAARSQPAYDPMALMKNEGLSPPDIFEREERNPVFANRREFFLKDRLHELFERQGLDAEVLSVECRRSSCRLVAQSESVEIEQFFTDMQSAQWGTAFAPRIVDREEGKAVSIHMLFDPSTRDHENYEDSFFRFR